MLRASFRKFRPPAIADDAATIAYTDPSGAVRIVSSRSGQTLRRVTPPDGRSLTLEDYSADGLSLLTMDYEAARVWDLTSSEEPAPVPAETLMGQPQEAVFCPDASRVAVLFSSRKILVVDLTSGKTVSTIDAGVGLWSIMCDSSGTRLMTYGGEPTLSGHGERRRTRFVS